MANIFIDNTLIKDKESAKLQCKLNKEDNLSNDTVTATLIVYVKRAGAPLMSLDIQRACKEGDSVIFTAAEITSALPSGIELKETIGPVRVGGCETKTMILTEKGHGLGDIVYWDGNKLDYAYYKDWNKNLGEAVGVCFIPTSHAAVWGDGKARFLAVTGVNADGTAASSEQLLYWDSSSQYRDAGLTKHTKVPTWSNTVGGSVGSSGYGYISSDKFTSGTQNVIDTTTKYRSTPYIPSPYAADGSFYEDYRRTITGYNNVLSDFNGKVNTATIVTALGATGGQAAKACSLYSTSGTAAGNWYLPAAGELAYIMPRFNVIQSAFTACSGVLLDSSNYYWSSTEYSSDYAYGVETHDGYVDVNIKGSNYRVRPCVSLA